MPDRWGLVPNPNQKKTNYFIMQVFSGSKKLGQKVFSKGDPYDTNKSNANELNVAKEKISQKFGKSMFSTRSAFVNIFQDKQGDLFYYEFDSSVGYVKTPLIDTVNITAVMLQAKVTLENLKQRFAGS